MSIFDFFANVRHNRELKRDGLLGDVGRDVVPTNKIVETDDEKAWHLSDGTMTHDYPGWKKYKWNVIAKYGDDES